MSYSYRHLAIFVDTAQTGCISDCSTHQPFQALDPPSVSKSTVLDVIR